MKITRFQVRNFKSFLDSGEVALKPGFNVITGQNSAGKTSMLEAMGLRFVGAPHRSLRTVPVPAAAFSQESVVDIEFSVERQELFYMMGNGQYPLPAPEPGFAIPGNSPYRPRQNENRLLAWLSHEAEFKLALRIPRGGVEPLSATGLVLGKYAHSPTDSDGALSTLIISTDGEKFVLNSFGRDRAIQYLTTSLLGVLTSRIYRFRAERFNVGKCPFGSSGVQRRCGKPA